MKKKTIINIAVILVVILVLGCLAAFVKDLLYRNAMEIMESQRSSAQADGSYIVENGNVKFRLICPEGWDVASSTYILQFDPDADRVIANAIARNDDATLEDILKLRLDIYCEHYEGVESGSGDIIHGFPTAWIKTDSIYECFMQIPHEDGFLLLDVKNMNAEDPFPFLRILANAVQGPVQ